MKVPAGAEICDGAWFDGSDEPDRKDAVALLDRIRDIVLADESRLDMSEWHCLTAHCLAGHAQVLAGLPNYADTAHRDGARLLGRWGAPLFFQDDETVLDYLQAKKYLEIC